MSRYKIATKTDKLRIQIAKEVFGEIEDSDGVRDIPSWEIFEKCLEQHKRIIKLEAENDLVRNTKINTNKMECIHLQAEIQELQDQLTLTEKALELACETYWNDCGMEDCPADIMDNFTDTYEKCKTCPNGGDGFVNDKGCCWVDYFKTKAKEMIEK